jgi:hypothetical protein
MAPLVGNSSWISQKPLEADTVTESAKAVAFGAIGGATSAALFGWWVSSPSSVVLPQARSASLLYGANCVSHCCVCSVNIDTRGTAGLLGSFSFTLHSVAKYRGKDDSLNTVAGGLVMGSLLGLHSALFAEVKVSNLFLIHTSR